MNYITSYCHISFNKYSINSKNAHSFSSDTIDDFTKELYKELDLDYSKFYKMDTLSKTAFLGTELLKKECPEINNYKDNEIAMLFANNNSSAITDAKFQDTYKNGGIPSPSLFVYTLPNILIGEIAIRNKWYGENMFTVAEKFDAEYFSNYCNILLNKNSEASICGWLDVDNNKIEAFFFFVTKRDLKQLNLQFGLKQLSEIFESN